MAYSITLVVKKEAEGDGPLAEIKKYIEEKEGKIISLNELGKANLVTSRKAPESSIYKIETEILPENIEKIKKKIDHEKEIISYLFEKTRVFKEKKKTKEQKDKIKAAKDKPTKIDKKKEASKTKKVIASMQEEEKKIKDLDSTLDKILNE